MHPRLKIAVEAVLVCELKSYTWTINNFIEALRMGVLAKQRRPASAVQLAQQAPQRNNRRPRFDGARERPPARQMIGVPWVISAKNVAFCPNNKNSSDIDAARRRRHGQSCFTFQFASLRKLLRQKKLDNLSWTDHVN